MQPREEIINDSVRNWDRKRDGGATPVMATARLLAEAGRFDDLTLAMFEFKHRFASDPAVMRFVIPKIPAIVLNHYIYAQAGVSGSTILKHYKDKGMADAIEKAALREGQLQHAVMTVVEQLRELEKQPAA